MKKMKIKTRLALSITLLSVFGVATGTIAWFYHINKISNINGQGSTDSAYFAYGRGTLEEPYGIADVRHLNNLAWLQYHGNFDDGHFYFELANDINMNGAQYVIPPIGTEEHPFIGVFNGKGHTISNIMVSNDPGAFTNKPTKITYNQSKAEIVGFFGVVGELDDDSYSSSVNTIKDVTLDNLTVESKTTNTLIGLAAGYVNAEMSGVKVGTSTISVNGNSAKSYTNNLSDYGLVGYTTKTASSGTYQQKISNCYDSSTTGDDAGWGGSIDFKTFYGRLDTLRTNYARQKYTLGTVYNDVYEESGNRISHEIYTGKSKSYHLVYNEDITKNGVTYNPKIGALKANMNNDTLTSATLYYLAGGHYTVAKTRKYYDHEGFKIYKTVNGVTHYLGAANLTISDNVAVADKTGANASQALVWELFDGNSGKITTKYNNVTYYLAIASNGTDLIIRSSSANGTTFTKSTDENGNVRLSIAKDGSNSYLDYNGSWKMVNPPTLSPYNPPAVTAPDPGTEEEYAAAHGLNPDNYHGAYQITYMDGDTKRFISLSGSSIVTSTEPFTNGWNFNGGTSLPTSGNQYTIRIYNTNYQIGHSNNNALSYTNTSTEWKATQSNGSWKFSYDVSSGGCGGGTTTYYMKRNGSTLSVAEGDNNDTFTLEATATSVSTYNSSLHDAWVAATNLYEEQVAAQEEYINVTRPAEEEEYATSLANHNAAFTTAYIPVEEISEANGNVVSGPDYQDVDRYEGMDYELDQDVTYLPLTVESSLEAKTTNTGYIIGGETYTSVNSAASSGNARIASFYKISESITNYNRSTGEFNANSVYTYDASGIHTIDDNNHNFVKYDESKDKIEATLNSNEDKVYGLHFTSTGITKDALVTARYAAINGEEFTNYKMPANSIDFNLREQGYINFFAGTYGYSGSSDTTVDSFFSLHQIQRSGTSIVSIDEIQEVYSDGENGHSYIYKFTNGGQFSVPYSIDPYASKKYYVLGTKHLITDTEHGGYSDGIYHKISASEFNSNYASTFTKVFDMSWLKDHSYFSSGSGNITEAFHKAFYFEIPTNPGEYALGTVTGKTYGAYLIYLDIAANAANRDKITAYAVCTFQSGTSYPVGVDFNVSTLEGESGGETAAILIYAGASSSGDVDFEVNGAAVGYESDFTTKYSYTALPLSGADPPLPADVPPANGTRTIHTKIFSTDGTIWNIVTVEDLDSEGEPSSDARFVSIKHDDETMTEDDLPDSFVLSTIRKNIKTNIVSLTRESGTNVFDATAIFSGTDNKEVAISLDATGIVIGVSDLADGYTFTINGTPITRDPQTYP